MISTIEELVYYFLDEGCIFKSNDPIGFLSK